MNTRILVALSAFGLASLTAAHAQSVTVTDLNPPGLTRSFGTAASGGKQAGYAFAAGSSNFHAQLWAGTPGSAIDLNPANFTVSYAFALAGGSEVGYGYGTATTNNYHALLWTGTAASAVDLNPTNISGITSSIAEGVSGNTQVGYSIVTGGGTGSNGHALLWTGTAASAVDLNPTNVTGITSSFALAVSGSTVVGNGYGIGTGSNKHALLWMGTASSAVDLNPTNIVGFTNTFAQNVSGGTEVGYGNGSATGGNNHALLWSGTAGSAVDLNPTNIAGITDSQALGVSGGLQVGYGDGPATSFNSHALVWTGTAGSAFDLNAFLPNGFNTSSQAFGVDSNGDIVGYGQGSSGTHAFLWHLASAPEPSPAAALIIGILGVGILALKARRARHAI